MNFSAKKAKRRCMNTTTTYVQKASAILEAIYAVIKYTARSGENSITWTERMDTITLDIIRSKLVTLGYTVTEEQKTFSLTGINTFKLFIKW